MPLVLHQQRSAGAVPREPKASIDDRVLGALRARGDGAGATGACLAGALGEHPVRVLSALVRLELRQRVRCVETGARAASYALARWEATTAG